MSYLGSLREERAELNALLPDSPKGCQEGVLNAVLPGILRNNMLLFPGIVIDGRR